MAGRALIAHTSRVFGFLMETFVAGPCVLVHVEDRAQASILKLHSWSRGKPVLELSWCLCAAD